MLTEEQEKQVIALLATDAKAKAYRNGAYTKLIEAARNYAMMKATGSYLDKNGVIMRVSLSDKQSRTEYYLEDMRHAAEDMFLEEALAGASK